MSLLVTGAAGFIGYHVSRALLARGEAVLGLDNLNDYYDVALKRARLGELLPLPGFRFLERDLADHESVLAELAAEPIDRIVHLAAQPGVRYSLVNPFAYVRSNLLGHTTVLELGRRLPKLRHLVYASSSSVYGGNAKLPFAVQDRTDHPVSLYAATKRSDELISHSYSHLFGMPQTGLRFFTVYGPWGRPDMAVYSFTRAIHQGEPIRVFNGGDMKRDFTFVDDIVRGVLGALDQPPAQGGGAPHRLYNIGNNNPEPLLTLVALIEAALGRQAKVVFEPMPPGDVKETCADIDSIRRDLGFQPTTPLAVGIPEFVRWYLSYHGAVDGGRTETAG